MANYKIKRVYPCYTGGNIYVYIGELSNGQGFVANDLWTGETGDIAITDKFQENYFDDFYELQDHVVEYIDNDTEEARLFWNKMIDWILKNKPVHDFCNYQEYDLTIRKVKKVRK